MILSYSILSNYVKPIKIFIIMSNLTKQNQNYFLITRLMLQFWFERMHEPGDWSVNSADENFAFR